MKIVVKRVGSGKELCELSELEPSSTIADVKKAIFKKKSNFYPDRQQLKDGQDRKATTLKDDKTLRSLGLGDNDTIYFKDLGPQIGWTTVFMCEYAGPLFTYLIFYFRPDFIYANREAPMHQVVHIAMACWTFHYAKRLFETVFVHRFSHNTMPIRNLFKNCGYYWGSAAFVSYFVNHPLYTPAMYGNGQIYTGLTLFVVGELGNLSIHLALRNLRKPGTKERKIPYPTGNPFTLLFNQVSCPNYTYEFVLWLGFTLMAQSLPALLFTLAGLVQMSLWALGKHRNYLKEFGQYPRSRKAILPFLL